MSIKTPPDPATEWLAHPCKDYVIVSDTPQYQVEDDEENDVGDSDHLPYHPLFSMYPGTRGVEVGAVSKELSEFADLAGDDDYPLHGTPPPVESLKGVVIGVSTDGAEGLEGNAGDGALPGEAAPVAILRAKL